MKKIKVGNSFAFVDDSDFELVSGFSWHNVGGYAQTQKREENKIISIYMHRMILNPPNGKVIDHINGNGLDNRRENIRICTRKENQRNQRIRRTNTSGYIGVDFNKNKFRATVDKKFIGYYETAIEAARARDEKAKELYGEFAKLNFGD